MDIIFDIDGTLMNRDHRLHFLEKKRKDWHSFMSKIDDDTPYQDMQNLLFSIYSDDNNRVIFCSGRTDNYREVTLKQLSGLLKLSETPVSIQKEIVLYMRAEGDRRQDDLVKSDLLDKIRIDGFDPVIAFDDRDKVVKMWRERGLRCLQVDRGDF